MADETNQEKLEEDKPTKMGGLKGLAFGLITFAVAYYFYTTMTKYENGEGVTMNTILLFAYKLLGKNISTGILGLLGALLSFGGIKEFMSASK